MNRTVTRMFVVTFLVPVAVNFAWEMAQSVLFASIANHLFPRPESELSHGNRVVFDQRFRNS